MDFRLNRESRLISGHDDDTYLAYAGMRANDVIEPHRVRRRKRRGRAIAFDTVLGVVAEKRTLYADLKDTKTPARAREAILSAVSDLQKAHRAGDVVLMSHEFGHERFLLQQLGIRYALKQSTELSEDDGVALMKEAERLGCSYLCYPAPPEHARLSAASETVKLIVPFWGVDRLRAMPAYYKAGTRMFITKRATVTLQRAAAGALRAKDEIESAEAA